MALRLGYDQGPSLAFRWLDGYAEFDDAQSLKVRAGLDEFFAWHRRTPAARLCRAAGPGPGRAAADSATAGAHVRLEPASCAARFDTALERAVPTLAEVVPTLSLQQLGQHREAVRRQERGVPRRLPAAATRRSARRPRPSARSSAPRTSTAGSTRRSAPSSPARSPNRRGTATSPTPSGCAASRTCWPWRAGWPRAAPPRPRREAEVRAWVKRLAALAARELPALPGAPRRRTTARYAADLHNLTTRRAAQEGGEEAQGLGGRACALSPAKAR